MDEGRFKYCGPFHAPTIRQLFPNASVPDGPAGGARSGQAAQASNNMLAVGPVAPGKAASTYSALHAQVGYVSQATRPQTFSGAPPYGFPPNPYDAHLRNGVPVYGMAFGNEAPKQLEVVVDSYKGPRLKAPVELSKAPKGGYGEMIARWRWYLIVPWFLFMCCAAQSARTWSDIWISQWTAKKNTWGEPFGMGVPGKWEYFGIYCAFIGMFFILQVRFLCT